MSEGLKIIHENVFQSCKFVGNLVIPDNTTKIMNYAFYKCSFDGTLKLSENLEIIQESAFEQCKFVGDLIIPNNFIEIGANAFSDCGFDGTLLLSKNIIKLIFKILKIANSQMI